MTHTWLLRSQYKSLDEAVPLTKCLKSLSRRVAWAGDLRPPGTAAVVKPQGSASRHTDQKCQGVLTVGDILEQLQESRRYSFRTCRKSRLPLSGHQLDFLPCLVPCDRNEPQLALFGGGCLVSESCPTPLQRYGLYRQAPLSAGFPRQEYSSGLPVPRPGLSMTGVELVFPALAGVFCTAEPSGKPSLSLNYPPVATGLVLSLATSAPHSNLQKCRAYRIRCSGKDGPSSLCFDRLAGDVNASTALSSGFLSWPFISRMSNVPPSDYPSPVKTIIMTTRCLINRRKTYESAIQGGWEYS